MMAESTNLVVLVLNHRFILVFFGGHRKCHRYGTVWRFGLRCVFDLSIEDRTHDVRFHPRTHELTPQT